LGCQINWRVPKYITSRVSEVDKLKVVSFVFKSSEYLFTQLFRRLRKSRRRQMTQKTQNCSLALPLLDQGGGGGNHAARHCVYSTASASAVYRSAPQLILYTAEAAATNCDSMIMSDAPWHYGASQQGRLKLPGTAVAGKEGRKERENKVDVHSQFQIIYVSYFYFLQFIWPPMSPNAPSRLLYIWEPWTE
jgi:hypothetical protein